MLFDFVRRSLPARAARATLAASVAGGVASLALAGITTLPASAQVTERQGASVPGGKIRDCHGYVRHVSDANIRVHCLDGRPADLSFLYAPNYATLFSNGKSVQTKDLKPGTPVHVEFTQSLGVRKAYKIFVANPRGHGLYGFKS